MCEHCWSLALSGDDRGAESYRPDTLPEVVLWPCATALRTVDLGVGADLDPDLILALAIAEHDIAEEEYEPDEREPFDSLELDDQAYLMYEAKLWLTALRRYIRERL